MKKIVTGVLAVLFIFSSICLAVSFSDISGHWGEKYITELTNKGVINGFPDGTYRPEGVIKKGEFLKLLMVASLPNEDWTMPNVKYNHWASIYIEAAERNGIIEEGEIAEENVDDEISRVEVVRLLGMSDILLRSANQLGVDAEFYDIQDISDEEYSMLCHCVGQGYIQGYEDSTFKPNKTLTRAEVATILSRYINK